MIIKGIIILTRFDRTDAYVSKSATSSCERLREESAFTISWKRYRKNTPAV